MTNPSFSLEEWTPTHPCWQELIHFMNAEGQAYYWQQEAYFTQFQHYYLVAVHADELVGFLQFFLQPMEKHYSKQKFLPLQYAKSGGDKELE